ncbi:MAG: LEA type 2 family protein [Treponema sp.]|nr:LEA type 2 family protein [Treponema sp.]
MKKIATAFIISAVFCLWFSSCESLRGLLQEPKVSFRTVDLASISFNGVDMICRLNVENPNAFDIPFPEIEWQFFINDNFFIGGKLSNDTKLKSRRTVTVDVPFNVTYAGLFNSIASLWGTKEAGFHVALGVRFPLPILDQKTYNMDFRGTIPLLQIPKIQGGSFSTGKIDLNGVEQNWTFTIDNPNVFPIPVPDLNYNYTVNGIPLIRSGIASTGLIAASSATPITIKVGVQYSDIIALLGSLGSGTQLSSLMKLDSSFAIPAMEGITSSFEMPAILPVFHMPEISFQGINVKNMSLLGLDLVINWEIDNKNDFPLDLSNFNYDLMVNNSPWAQGTLAAPPRANARSKTVIPVEVNISTLSLVTQIADLVTRGTSVNFTTRGSFNFQGTSAGLERTGLPFSLSGLTRLLRL